ncbi:hypothetical protein NE237_009701 [Protea cynaroides]|uniref:Glucosamine/galactosamine-6-phosphate isomerase domain-containing protein n=1 Tax=Protea cynaroides TaxID=273540 RepID=A0A9Q0KZ50_9MAGN|nr:hypothetical protein NE237_009701 [Protea cynaroides]
MIASGAIEELRKCDLDEKPDELLIRRLLKKQWPFLGVPRIEGILMGKLCETPYNNTVDWSKWYIFWADERVVAKNHADSNYKLAKDGLLSKTPAFQGYGLSFSLLQYGATGTSHAYNSSF